jgi:hypothetical protein
MRVLITISRANGLGLLIMSPLSPAAVAKIAVIKDATKHFKETGHLVIKLYNSAKIDNSILSIRS